MRVKDIPKEKLQYFESLGIDIKSKYFRNHYRNGRLNNIDENYVEEVQKYFKKHFKREICPVTHIAYAHVTGEKNIKIFPQYMFRQEFLPVFNDYLQTDIYLDKALYDTMFDTDQQTHTVVRRVRRKFYDHENNEISFEEVKSTLLSDSLEYIIKPSDTNNGIGIRKMKVIEDELKVDDNNVNQEYLDKEYGNNFVVQRVIQQHENMAFLHPASVNTLRMVTFRWNKEIKNLYTFARFGHSNEIKDNAGSGGIVVGVKDNGEFMEYGVQKSNLIEKHPTTKNKIKDLKPVPNYEAAKRLVRKLHSKILHHNYVAWDIAIDKTETPIFIEANFFGGSWYNQLSLKTPMFGDMTEEVLATIAKYRDQTDELDTRNISRRDLGKCTKRLTKQRKKNRKLRKNNRKLKRQNKRSKRKYEKRLKKKDNQLQEIKSKYSQLDQRIKEIKNSKSWRYTRLFRRKR